MENFGGESHDGSFHSQSKHSERNDDHGGSLKRQRVDTTMSTLTFLVDSELTSLIVGKGGSTIRQLESDFQVRIQLDRPNPAERTPERPVVISSGTIENKVMAVRNITEMLLSAKPASQATIKLVIPAEVAPVIVGKQGSSVKQLMASSGTHIDVRRDGDNLSLPPQLSGSRLTVIIGALDNCCSALSMIAHRLQELDSGPSQSNHSSAILSRAPAPPVEVHYRRGMDSSNFMHGPPNPFFGMSSDMGMMRQSAHGFGGPMNIQAFMPQTPVHVPTPSFSRDRGSKGNATCTLNMYVPAGIVRLVIGKGGSNIKEVIRQCDDLVNINVQREEEAAPAPPEMCGGTPMRLVLIKGPSNAALRAAHIIQERISGEYEDLQWTVVALHPPGSEHGHGGGGGGSGRM